jgi:hypothetical protein
MSSRSAEGHYSDKSEQSQEDREKSDQEDKDFFAELTEEKIHELQRTAYARSLEPLSEDEIAEMMAALDDSIGPDEVVAPASVAPVADWLTDLRELARKHGPFSAAQIQQIVRELDAPGKEPGR